MGSFIAGMLARLASSLSILLLAATSFASHIEFSSSFILSSSLLMSFLSVLRFRSISLRGVSLGVLIWELALLVWAVSISWEWLSCCDPLVFASLACALYAFLCSRWVFMRSISEKLLLLLIISSWDELLLLSWPIFNLWSLNAKYLLGIQKFSLIEGLKSYLVRELDGYESLSSLFFPRIPFGAKFMFVID